MQKIFQFKSNDCESLKKLNELLETQQSWYIVNTSIVAIGDCETMNTFVLQKNEKCEYKSRLNESKVKEEDLTKNLNQVSDMFAALLKSLADDKN
jgi:hypothetical protein